MSAREEFEADGRLFPCPNPRHEFAIWRFIGQWRWGSQGWSTLTDLGVLHTDFLRVGRMETVDRTRAYCLVVWRLYVMVGILPPNAKVTGAAPTNGERSDDL